MFNTIIEGITIGLCTSIPVGPIAILIIQRTLQKGRMHGFTSGLGAATSDTFYALLAIVGLSVVLSFIEENKLIIQIAGSVIMMIFGVYIFFQNPAKNIEKSKTDKSSYWQEYLTAFLLTLSNPLMIFLYIGLFAQYNFISSESHFIEIAIGICSVFLGAGLWWFCLTLLASIFRKRFNIRGLWILNKATGILISVISLVALISSISGFSLSV
jgi:threonine/homoserine/homoserine lactone efflux protein